MNYIVALTNSEYNAVETGYLYATYEIPGLDGYGTLCTPVPLSSKERGESSKQISNSIRYQIRSICL